MSPFTQFVVVLVVVSLLVTYAAAFLFWKEYRHSAPPVRGLAVFLALVVLTVVVVACSVAVVGFHHLVIGA